MSTITVNLPDGSVKELEEGATLADVAASIGSGLAKASLAGKINGQLADCQGCPLFELFDRAVGEVDGDGAHGAILSALAREQTEGDLPLQRLGNRPSRKD